MKLNDQLFEDLARIASGAASTVSGLRNQFDARRDAGDASSVSREEFDAVAAMAAKAREAQDDLLKRLKAIEQKIGIDEPATEPGEDI